MSSRLAGFFRVSNPMIRKELRQRLRERRAWLLPFLYLLVLSGTVAFCYYMVVQDQLRMGKELQGADIGVAIFYTVLITQLVVLLLMAPVFSAGSITIEKEQRTLGALLTSLLTPPQIWWGKFVSALLYLFLLLASAMPLLALSFAFGGVEPMALFKATAAMALVLSSISSIGLWCSATFRRSVHSTAAAYAIVLVLSIVTAVAFGILLSQWEQTRGANLLDPPPVFVQAPLFLNPIYPFLSLLDGAELRKFAFPVSSYLLYIATGLLAAAFAMRRLRRSGEQI